MTVAISNVQLMNLVDFELSVCFCMPLETLKMELKKVLFLILLLVQSYALEYNAGSSTFGRNLFWFSDNKIRLDSVSDKTYLHSFENEWNKLSTYIIYKNSNSEQKHKNLSDFIELSCKDCDLTKIPSKLFEKFTELESFSAAHVGLEKVYRDDFRMAGHLKVLNLSSNKISELENKLFLHCEAIEKIDLSKNQISWIHDNAFEGISDKLDAIDLSSSKIASFKKDFVISLAGLSKQLSEINLERNQIEEVIISNKFGYEILFGYSIKVNKLLLADNRLKKYDFSYLYVKTLTLGNNKLTNLSILSSATTNINAENNEIADFKCYHCSLEVVVLSGNKNLGSKALNELKTAKNLKVLDLSDTSLTSLNVDAFANLESLEHLSIDRNGISALEFGLFSNQPSLLSLNISHNSLVNIDLHMLSTMTSLKSLDIRGNKIAKIERFDLLKKILPELSTVGIEGNKFTCSYLSKMSANLKQQNVTIIDPLMPVKNVSNFKGFVCDGNSFDSTNDNFLLNTLLFNASNYEIVEKLNQHDGEIEKIDKHILRILSFQNRQEDAQASRFLDGIAIFFISLVASSIMIYISFKLYARKLQTLGRATPT